MKRTMLLSCLVVGLLIATTSISVAQVPASQDTIVIPGGTENAGLLEATINGDTTEAGSRIHPNRVYKLNHSTLYTQYAAIDIKNPTGTLIIVGEKGGTKPVILPTEVGSVKPGINSVIGSIKLDNIHMCGMISDGTLNNNLWNGSTSNGLPQSVEVNNCLFEFISLDLFSCDGYTAGAKFRFSNSYFRNFFNPDIWWGGRIFYCKQPIDTLWVENCTVTDGGMIFLQQNSLCKFAYFNHNTIINSNKYWLLGVYYLEGYWVNNLFINQNWVGEDLENIANGSQDPDPGMLMGTIGLDTIMTFTKPHINIQPEFLLADGTIDPSKCGPDKIKVLVSDNVLWTDTVMLEAYYHNKAIGGYGPYGTAFLDTCPASYLGWCGCGNAPYKVVNVPSIWMNPRTAGLFSGIYPRIKQQNNYINVEVTTVTPAIKDAATADQMAKWNACHYGVPGFNSLTDILQSAYIFGDYDPKTIPGYKTEDGDGITKFTDLNENFAQSGTVKTSTIDGWPIGALHWTNDIDSYNSADAYAKVRTEWDPPLGIKDITSGIPQSYCLVQNYPNPFNPSTKIEFSLPQSEYLTLKVFNLLGQEIATLVNENMAAGTYEVDFDASNLSSGLYIYKLEAGSFTSSKKMMFLK